MYLCLYCTKLEPIFKIVIISVPRVLKHLCAVAQSFLKEKVRGNAERLKYHQLSRSKNGLSFAETIFWGHGFRKTSTDSLFWNSGFTSGGGRGLRKESSACSSFCFGGGGAETIQPSNNDSC